MPSNSFAPQLFFLLNRERDPKDLETIIIAVGLHLHTGPANKREKKHNPHILHNGMGRFMNARSSWNRRRAQRWAGSNGFPWTTRSWSGRECMRNVREYAMTYKTIICSMYPCHLYIDFNIHNMYTNTLFSGICTQNSQLHEAWNH
jgi:hypothetical protein